MYCEVHIVSDPNHQSESCGGVGGDDGSGGSGGRGRADMEAVAVHWS